MLSTLVSMALVAPFAPAETPPEPPHARSYRYSGFGRTSCGGGFTPSRAEVHLCSDGSRLFVVRTSYVEPGRAREAFDLLLGRGGTTIARSVALDDRGRARIIFAADQVRDPENMTVYAFSSYAVAWVEGDTLVAVYGPSPMHALELADQT